MTQWLVRQWLLGLLLRHEHRTQVLKFAAKTQKVPTTSKTVHGDPHSETICCHLSNHSFLSACCRSSLVGHHLINADSKHEFQTDCCQSILWWHQTRTLINRGRLAHPIAQGPHFWRPVLDFQRLMAFPTPRPLWVDRPLVAMVRSIRHSRNLAKLSLRLPSLRDPMKQLTIPWVKH